MSTMVLMHGSWHYGSLWDAVRRELESAGYEVHTPTCGGLRDGDDLRAYDLDASVAVALEYVRDHRLNDFVLVGHSWGGTVIMKMAEALGEHVRRLVFLNAFVPQDGNAVVDEVYPPIMQELVDSYHARNDGGVMCPFTTWREMFMNDADFATASDCYQKLRPHPFRTLTQKVDYSKFYALDIPRSYVNFLEDNCIGQDERWGWHPRMSQRLGIYRLVQGHGGHEVMFTNPRLLADKLIEAGRD